MAVYVTVPVSTEVIESNPDCKFNGAYENGVLLITIDTRHQNHHQRLGASRKRIVEIFPQVHRRDLHALGPQAHRRGFDV